MKTNAEIKSTMLDIETKKQSYYFKFKYLVLFILFFSCFMGMLIDEFKLPSSINYVLDLANIFILIFLIVKNKYLIQIYRTLPMIFGSIIVFSAIALVSGLINLESPILFLYGARVLLRYFVFIFGCISLLKKEDLPKIFNAFFIIQIISFILALYQRLILNLSWDYLGGIFGHGNGTILNPFQTMIYTYFLLSYLNNNKNAAKLIFVALSSLIIAGLAEEKAFFLYFVIATAACLILAKKSYRSILIIGFSVACIFVGIIMLISIGGVESILAMIDLEHILDYLQIQSSKMNRINPYLQINRDFFKTDISKYLFGYGLGNCSASESSIFTSNFYLQNSDLSYQYYTHSFVLLETGYLGFISFLLILISTLFFSIKHRKVNKFYSSLSIIMSIIALLSMMFAPSLINGLSYIVYFGVFIFPIYYFQNKNGYGGNEVYNAIKSFK